jgi:Mrp family chromosome partitioning ATPase
MTIQEFIDICREKFGEDVEISYVHPSLYVICISDDFQGLDDDAKEEKFLQKTNITQDVFSKLISNVNISPYFISRQERASRFSFIDKSAKFQHWLPLLDKGARLPISPAEQGPIRAVHFYGFKGGQARSTVLAMLAKNLANDGYRVLVVDADIEAPSLDELFEVGVPSVDSTLMGACGWTDSVHPIPAYAATASRGLVDIIPCRPRTDSYDMDFATFGLRVALDVKTLRVGIEKIKQLVVGTRGQPLYDLVLFDHRTGIAPSVLPIVRAWQGPTVVSVRPDGLSTQAVSAFETLFSQNPSVPGAFVYYSMSEEDRRADLVDSPDNPVIKLLGALANSLALGAEEPEPLAPELLHQYWIGWHLDSAFLTKNSPEVEDLDKKNRDAISTLREVIALSEPAKQPSDLLKPSETSPSGALDTGWFIETNDIARLFAPASRVSYIAGRKGTGKTRLYREMVARKLAQPLFSSADFTDGGLQSNSAGFDKLLAACDGDLKRFWWALLYVSLRCADTGNTLDFQISLDEFCASTVEDRLKNSQSFNVAQLVNQGSIERVFVIDGIETAVPVLRLRIFIEELLLFMLTLQSDSIFKNCQCRLFIRSDLLNSASQNIEQQTNQRIVHLRWDSRSIFNYVLARIERLPWFRQQFPVACARITQHLDEIRSGSLTGKAYNEILLEIFPPKLKRNNLQTLTFLETYFSDSSGKVGDGTSFYPRLFEQFLTEIAKIGTDNPESALENDRISHAIVLDAHSTATIQFVNEVKTELYVLLDLATDTGDNRQMIDTLVEAFDGFQTPFQLEKALETLHGKIPGSEKAKLRAALLQMTEVGIFERHPKNPGELRAGRLYKSALRMKYVR